MLAFMGTIRHHPDTTKTRRRITSIPALQLRLDNRRNSIGSQSDSIESIGCSQTQSQGSQEPKTPAYQIQQLTCSLPWPSPSMAAVTSPFTDQGGVPELKVALDCTGPSSASETHPEALPATRYEAPRDRIWKVPGSVKYPEGRDCTLLDSKEMKSLSATVQAKHVHQSPRT